MPMTRLPYWARLTLAAAGGATLMIALGQAVGLVNQSCTILCQPLPAALFGATMTLAMFGRDLRPVDPPGA